MKRTLLTVGLFAMLLGAVGAVHAAGDAAAGKAKASGCAGCHGANGEGTAAGPKLAGKSETDLVQAMQEFKSGKRANAAMKAFVGKFSDQDMANVAAYFASLK